MAREYHKRPSEILSIDDEYVAYCFDQAIFEFNLKVRNKKTPRFKDEEIKHVNPGLAMLTKLSKKR